MGPQTHVFVKDQGDYDEVFIGSAPEHAYVIAPDNRCDDGRLLPRVKCKCGWKGRAGQLLGVDENDTMWCPQCRTWGNWVYR